MTQDTDPKEAGRQALRAFAKGDDFPGQGAEDGQFSGASGVLFEQAMAQTRMAVCLSDPRQPDAPIVFANRAFTELTGYGLDEILGRNCRFLQGEDTDPEVVKRIRTALNDQSVIVVELINYRKDGTRFWNALHLGPIYDDAGDLLYYFGSQWDVSDVHAARADEAHSKAISREVSHRMKNMFSVISAIVSMTGRATGDVATANLINERIATLGRANEPSLDKAHLGFTDIGPVFRNVLRPFDTSGDRIRLSGPEAHVTDSLGSMIGLILNELAANARKFGALSAEGGTVDVVWSYNHSNQNDAGALIIDWRESGGPAIEKEPTAKGAGFRIIDTFLRTIDGQIDYEWAATGLRSRLSVPHRR